MARFFKKTEVTRRSFFGDLLSGAAGVWVTLTGGAMLSSGCSTPTKYGGPPVPASPSTQPISAPKPPSVHAQAEYGVRHRPAPSPTGQHGQGLATPKPKPEPPPKKPIPDPHPEPRPKYGIARPKYGIRRPPKLPKPKKPPKRES